MDQEKFLAGVTMRFRRDRRPRPEWDHDHCQFCFATFMVEGLPDVLNEGYTTEDEYYWVCSKSFEDFKERFDWTVAP
jgi:hypothetical protein